MKFLKCVTLAFRSFRVPDLGYPGGNPDDPDCIPSSQNEFGWTPKSCF